MKAERLSEGVRDRLLKWRHSGFSVYGAPVVLREERERLAQQIPDARQYLVRYYGPVPIVHAGSAVSVTTARNSLLVREGLTNKAGNLAW